jgi:hypothetical protein
LAAVSRTNNPFAGLLMEAMAAVFILGINNPLLLLLISSIALASGVVVPMPVFCAQSDEKNMPWVATNKKRFFIFMQFNYLKLFQQGRSLAGAFQMHQIFFTCYY